jgi:hypothetical protein
VLALDASVNSDRFRNVRLFSDRISLGVSLGSRHDQPIGELLQPSSVWNSVPIANQIPLRIDLQSGFGGNVIRRQIASAKAIGIDTNQMTEIGNRA